MSHLLLMTQQAPTSRSLSASWPRVWATRNPFLTSTHVRAKTSIRSHPQASSAKGSVAGASCASLSYALRPERAATSFLFALARRAVASGCTLA